MTGDDPFTLLPRLAWSGQFDPLATAARAIAESRAIVAACRRSIEDAQRTIEQGHAQTARARSVLARFKSPRRYTGVMSDTTRRP
jgi:multidrug resistance efflux pump